MLNPPVLFGSRRRTQVLMLIALLEETRASEMAMILGVDLKTVQRILRALEDENVIVGRYIGRAWQCSLNPTFPAAKELKVLLLTLLRRDDETFNAAGSVRRCPRRRGKEL